MAKKRMQNRGSNKKAKKKNKATQKPERLNGHREIVVKCNGVFFRPGCKLDFCKKNFFLSLQKKPISNLLGDSGRKFIESLCKTKGIYGIALDENVCRVKLDKGTKKRDVDRITSRVISNIAQYVGLMPKMIEMA